MDWFCGTCDEKFKNREDRENHCAETGHGSRRMMRKSLLTEARKDKAK